jgi:hypothetical protein
MRRSLIRVVAGTAAVVGCLSVASSGIATATATGSPVHAYRPVWHAMPPIDAVLAAGDDAVLVPQAGLTGQATLVDQATGVSRTIAVGGPGCAPAAMSATAVLWTCNPPAPQAQWGAYLQSLQTGAVTRLPDVAMGTIRLGVDWAQADVLADPTISTHSNTVREFINLTTGQVRADRSQIRGRIYPDLDAPGLFRTACSPITVPGSPDPAAQDDVPGSITFFGSTAVLGDPDGAGILHVRRCGSRRSRTLRTPGVAADVADNGEILVWSEALGSTQLDGFVPRTGERFTITLPTASGIRFTGAIELNRRTVYAQGIGPDGRVASVRATLPAPLS